MCSFVALITLYDYNLIGWQVWAIEPAVTAELEQAREALESLHAHRQASAPPTTTSPSASPGAPSIAHLKECGFERFTVDRMHKEWHIGSDSIEKMADRAMREDHIHSDYVITTPGKRKELWARPKP
jgi:hypothetical protein